MHTTKTIENFKNKELQLNISGSASWHNDVKYKQNKNNTKKVQRKWVHIHWRSKLQYE